MTHAQKRAMRGQLSLSPSPHYMKDVTEKRLVESMLFPKVCFVKFVYHL